MAAQIIGTSKAIDDYLDSLPAIEGKQQEQLDRIAQLETENKQYEEEILRLSTLAGTSRLPRTPITVTWH
jgi:hypothetical protein